MGNIGYVGNKDKFKERSNRLRNIKDVKMAYEEKIIKGNPHCSECGWRPVKSTAVQLYSLEHFGRIVCYGCQWKLRKEEKDVKQNTTNDDREINGDGE